MSLQSYKFIIVGSSGVGKTSILKRLVEDQFDASQVSTVGVEFDSLVVTVQGQRVKLQIWDTAGQERFRSIAKAYYRNAVGVIVVFDITDRKSFDDLGGWLQDVHSLCDPNAIVQLIGNKCDLAAHRAVTIGECETFASHHHLKYTETSAKFGNNVRDVFISTAAQIMAKGLRTSNTGTPKTGPLVPQDGRGTGKEGKGCC